MAVFESTCPACGGNGKKKNDSGKGYPTEDCARCGGSGTIFVDEIPPENDSFREC
jgi:DnaJ-class molecular chaperone